MTPTNTATDPRQRAGEFEQRLRAIESELRRDGAQGNDPKAQALFETLAEVLGGAVKALDDYRNRREPAWR